MTDKDIETKLFEMGLAARLTSTWKEEAAGKWEDFSYCMEFELYEQPTDIQKRKISKLAYNWELDIEQHLYNRQHKETFITLTLKSIL